MSDVVENLTSEFISGKFCLMTFFKTNMVMLQQTLLNYRNVQYNDISFPEGVSPVVYNMLYAP